MARYISEIHVPIKKDEMNFQDRQIKQWGDVESRMQHQNAIPVSTTNTTVMSTAGQRPGTVVMGAAPLVHVQHRRSSWTAKDGQLVSADSEVFTQGHSMERRKLWEDEFERMRRDFFTLKPAEKSPQAMATMPLDPAMRSVFETDADGTQKFRVRFDVSEFQPEEIQVKVQENKLIVNARHEEKSAQTSVSREYSRQVDIPGTVDQEKMQCVLSKDGVLSVDAPVTTPVLSGPNAIFPVKSSTTPVKSLDVATPVKNPIVTEADGSRKLRLQVDIGEFRPEDVIVKTMDRKLIVHAEHEEKTSGRTLHKEFNKEYDLPESVDPSTIQAYIADDQQLTIEAPLKPVQRKMYSVTQSQDVRKVVVTKESSVTITDGQNRPVVTISVHRK